MNKIKQQLLSSSFVILFGSSYRLPFFKYPNNAKPFNVSGLAIMTVGSNKPNTTEMLNRSFAPFPILATERLTLRKLAIYDVKEIFTLRSDSEINKYLDRQVSTTIEDARNFINKVNENINKNDSLYWAITLGDTNILVGTICLFRFSDENGKCEIGYELLTNFQGQGIMKEAVEQVIDYAFNTIKVQEIGAFLHRDNQSSINLLEKSSFRNSNEPDETNPEIICYHLTNSSDNLK